MADRFSKATRPPLITDPRSAAPLESENALLQTDAALAELEAWLSSPGYRLRLSTILSLHRVLMIGLDDYAGLTRPDNVTIEGSGHVPPSAGTVPRLLEDLCDYVNDQWERKTALHLAAYILWKMNWIHPFTDGNGRTARSVSYLVLCAHIRYRLPGEETVPDQIAANKGPYYSALESADAAEKEGRVDVAALEALLDALLAKQLVHVLERANQPAARQGHPDRGGVALIEHSAPLKPGSMKSVLGWIERHPALASIIGAVVAAFLAWFLTKLG